MDAACNVFAVSVPICRRLRGVPAEDGSWVTFSASVGPLVVVVAGLLLCPAAIIIGLDLLLMGVAMAVIHGLFSLF